MKSVTITKSDCPMWKRVETGTILRMPDIQAERAIFNEWAEETPDNVLKFLLGEKIKRRKI